MWGHHPIDSHPFRSMSIGPPNLEIRLFQNDLENPRSRSWVRWKVGVAQLDIHDVFRFCFSSIGLGTIAMIWPIVCFAVKNLHWSKSFQQNSSKITPAQVRTMARGYVLDKGLTTFVTVWNLKWFGSSVTLSQDHQHVNKKIESIYINYEKFEGNGGSYGTGPKTICHPVSQGD